MSRGMIIENKTIEEAKSEDKFNKAVPQNLSNLEIVGDENY